MLHHQAHSGQQPSHLFYLGSVYSPATPSSTLQLATITSLLSRIGLLTYYTIKHALVSNRYTSSVLDFTTHSLHRHTRSSQRPSHLLHLESGHSHPTPPKRTPISNHSISSISNRSTHVLHHQVLLVSNCYTSSISDQVTHSLHYQVNFGQEPSHLYLGLGYSPTTSPSTLQLATIMSLSSRIKLLTSYITKHALVSNRHISFISDQITYSLLHQASFGQKPSRLYLRSGYSPTIPPSTL